VFPPSAGADVGSTEEQENIPHVGGILIANQGSVGSVSGTINGVHLRMTVVREASRSGSNMSMSTFLAIAHGLVRTMGRPIIEPCCRYTVSAAVLVRNRSRILPFEWCTVLPDSVVASAPQGGFVDALDAAACLPWHGMHRDVESDAADMVSSGLQHSRVIEGYQQLSLLLQTEGAVREGEALLSVVSLSRVPQALWLLRNETIAERLLLNACSAMCVISHGMCHEHGRMATLLHTPSLLFARLLADTGHAAFAHLLHLFRLLPYVWMDVPPIKDVAKLLFMEPSAAYVEGMTVSSNFIVSNTPAAHGVRPPPLTVLSEAPPLRLAACWMRPAMLAAETEQVLSTLDAGAFVWFLDMQPVAAASCASSAGDSPPPWALKHPLRMQAMGLAEFLCCASNPDSLLCREGDCVACPAGVVIARGVALTYASVLAVAAACTERLLAMARSVRPDCAPWDAVHEPCPPLMFGLVPCSVGAALPAVHRTDFNAPQLWGKVLLHCGGRMNDLPPPCATSRVDPFDVVRLCV
jgi:hypothetical protein